MDIAQRQYNSSPYFAYPLQVLPIRLKDPPPPKKKKTLKVIGDKISTSWRKR